MKHYLMSLPLPGGYLHCYLMSNDPAHVEHAAGKLLAAADGLGPGPAIPVVLSTDLDKEGIRTVRKALREHYPKAASMLREAKKFHISIWGLTGGANAKLLNLH